MATWVYGNWSAGSRIVWWYDVGPEYSGKRDVTLYTYIEMDATHSVYGNWPTSWDGWWGAGSGTCAVNLAAGQRQELFGHSVFTVTLSDSQINMSFQVGVTHFHGYVGAFLSVPVPARKPSKPGKPSVSRGSDTSHTVSWSKSNTLTSVNVQRQVDDEAAKAVGSPNGDLTSWTDTTTQSGRRYRYRVQAVSAGGSSEWSDWSEWVYTTPGKPGKPSATRVGDDIRVSADDTGHASSFNVQDDGVAVASDVGLPWDHVAPNPAVTHKYRVQGRVSSGTSNDQVLTSPFSDYSDTVQLAAPPNAPSGLKPNGSVLVDEDVVRFSWSHNPVDSSEQSAYELRYRLTGGAWTTVSGTTASSRDVTLVAGNYEFQVRTKGTHPDWSPWSATASFEVIARPTVAILLINPVTSLPLTVPWNFSQAQGKPQSAWVVELVQDGRVLESKNGSGATDSAVLSTHLTADSSYEARVQVTSAGIKSEWASFPFTTVFAPPAPGIITGLWNEDTGGIDVDVQLPEPASGTVTNYAPPIVGNGTYAEVGRNLFTNPRLVGDGTWAEVRRNYCKYPNAEGGVSTGWAKNNGTVTVSTSTDEFHSGTRSYRVDVAGGTTGSGVIAQMVSNGVATGGISDSVAVWVKAPSGTPMRMFIQERSTADALVSQGASTDFSATGKWQRVSASITKTAANNLTRPVIIVNSTASVTFYFDDVMAGPGLVPITYFDGSTMDNTMPQPEDFRVRWLGTANASESVMEIERVRGLSAVNCIAGVSTRDGKPAARLIPTGSSTTTLAQFLIPTGDARTSSTLIGTIHLSKPLTGSLHEYSRRASTTAPAFTDGSPPNAAGSYERRVYSGTLTSNYQAYLWHGGAKGSGDVWWTDIALFAGDYRYPWNGSPDDLSGITQPEDFRVRWLGTANASESVMEIETVANLPELVGGYYSDGQIRVLDEATITINPSDTIMIAPVGDNQTVNGVPVDGETHVQGEAVLSAGWWQDLGFFTGDYDGEFFDGGTGWVQIGGQPMLTKWNLDGTSTAYPPEPIVQAVLQRSLNQEAWEPVTESDTDIVLTDFEARSNGTTFYRLTTFSSAGATTETIIEVIADSQKIWVNAGAALENSIWLEYENAHPAFEGGRNRANFHYSGRKKAVPYAGQAITRVIDFEGWLEPAQSIDDAIEVIQSDGAVMQYRDPNGRRVYGIISGLSGRRETGNDWHSVRGRIEESSR